MRWAVLVPGFALRELLLFDKAKLAGRQVTPDDTQLRDELVRVVLPCLGFDFAEFTHLAD